MISRNKISSILDKISSRLNGFRFKMIDDKPYYKYKSNDYQPFCTGGGDNDFLEIVKDDTIPEFICQDDYEVLFIFVYDHSSSYNNQIYLDFSGTTYYRYPFHSRSVINSKTGVNGHLWCFAIPNVEKDYKIVFPQKNLSFIKIVAVKMNTTLRFRPTDEHLYFSDMTMIKSPMDTSPSNNRVVVFDEFMCHIRTTLPRFGKPTEQTLERYNGASGFFKQIYNKPQIVIVVACDDASEHIDYKTTGFEYFKYNEEDFDLMMHHREDGNNDVMDINIGFWVGWYPNDVISIKVNSIYQAISVFNANAGNAFAIFHVSGAVNTTSSYYDNIM